jgi:hypothetical protein
MCVGGAVTVGAAACARAAAIDAPLELLLPLLVKALLELPQAASTMLPDAARSAILFPRTNLLLL